MKRVIPLLKLLLIGVVAVQEVLLSRTLAASALVPLFVDSLLLLVLSYLLMRTVNSIQLYIIYIYSIVTKVTIIFFISFPKYIINKKVEDILSPSYYETFSENIFRVTIAILMTIVVYIMLFYITNFTLLNIHTISIENVLFFLIIIHVSIDFIDMSNFFCSSYFYFFLYYFRLKEEFSLFKDTDTFLKTSLDVHDIFDFYNFTLNIYEILFIVFGVLICLNISLHAYSLPNYSYECNIQKKGFHEEIPSKESNFQTHWHKNGTYITTPLQRFSFHHINDISSSHSGNMNMERYNRNFDNSVKHYWGSGDKTALGSKVGGDAMSCLKYISIYGFLFTDLSFLSARLFNFFVFSESSSRENIQKCIMICRKSRYYNHKRGIKKRQPGKGKSNIEENSAEGGQVEMVSAAGSQVKEATAEGRSTKENSGQDAINARRYSKGGSSPNWKGSYCSMHMLTKDIVSSEIINMNEVKNRYYYRREIDLKYKKIKKYFYFLYLQYNGINFKKCMSFYVDSIENNSTRYFMIFLFFFLLIAVKITILVIIYTFHFDNDFKKCLHELTFLYNISVLNSCLLLKISCIVILSYSISSLLVYIFLCSLFDGIFMFFLYFFNLSSYTFVLIILSQYNPSYNLFGYFNKSKNILIILSAFVYLVYLFLTDTYMFIYMLLGRKYITYKYRTNGKKKDVQGRARQNEEISVSISVISSLIVKLIKYMNGPLVLNKVIIGKNFIKNTRLDNYFFFCHIKEIYIKLIIYFSCCFLLSRDELIDISFILIIFSLNITTSVLYLVLSKVYRNVAIDCTLTQAMFIELSGGITKEHTYPVAGIEGTAECPRNCAAAYTKYSHDYLVLFDNCLNYF
ncbi:conserved Plasmodium protein, unknown function [Plasmodium ovale]|uniref:Uncharacterized protein n=1 Tax=Plasmodium ovale TaxID=36330 RepID=A0A1D3RD36_PLAOA|nr:conserved Plasmodium protein, unknown function [Plasmodium ovale]